MCKGQKTYSSTECLVTCYDSTPVTITARLPAGGYVPWQKINVEFDAENQSSQNIEHFFIQIVKVSDEQFSHLFVFIILSIFSYFRESNTQTLRITKIVK